LLNQHQLPVLLAFLAAAVFSFSSCAIKNDDLIGTIGQQKNIVLYTLCPHKNGVKMREHYLFKIKEDRVTLTKRQGDRIENKFTKDLNTAKDLEQLMIDSSNETPKNGSCEYYVKCGIQECNIYPDEDEIAAIENLIDSFSTPL